MSFEDSLPLILEKEGGFVNDPDDSGGATNKGIIQTTYDSYRERNGLEKRSVQYIQDKEVADIYEKEYWSACRCGDLPPSLALCVFDFAVNSGVSRAVKTLQRVVFATEDGVIGPATLSAVKHHVPDELVYAYCQERRRFYEGLADKRPKDRKFLRGWLKRVSDIERRAIQSERRTA